MELLKREYPINPPELMTSCNSEYIRETISNSTLNLSEMSLEMGYNKDYLYDCIYEGRINRNYLKMLSEMAGFSYEKALANKRKKKKD